jgi:hypothetical protein
MPTQLELEALHRQESSEHNAQILETKVTRGKADIFDGKIPAGQLPTPLAWTELTIADDEVVFPTITNDSEIKITLENTDGQPYQEVYFYGSLIVQSAPIIGSFITCWDSDNGTASAFRMVFDNATKTISFDNIPPYITLSFFYR